jgi:hypothetical protein
MRKSMRLALILTAVFLLTYTTGYGQMPPFGLYCPAGLHPDGYIDFSGLPPAPPLQGMTMPTPPVTAMLPVTGVPGLTMTIEIPGMYSAVSTQQGPAYSVNGGTLQLNGVAAGGIVSISFNQPIYGIGLNVGNPSGRFGYTYSLEVGDGSGPLPLFASRALGYTTDFFDPRTVSLQMVGLTTNFQTAAILFLAPVGTPTSEFFIATILSNLRIQSSAAPDPASSIPTEGLKQWLRSDKGTNYDFAFPFPNHTGSGIWQDQSGNGHDATPTPNHQPALTVDGRTCQRTWQFNGSSSFDFNLPIAGWSEMTVFLVANSANDPPTDSYYSEAAAILWTEDALWGNTFVSPYQTHVTRASGPHRSAIILATQGRAPA